MQEKINFKLHVHNEAKAKISQPDLFLVIKNCLLKDDIKAPVEIELTICDEKKIQELNEKFLAHDYITDVLSFPILNNKEIKKLNNKSGIVLLGEIVICKQATEKQAKEKGHSNLEEFNFLFEHGLKHLLGHHHN